MTNEDFGEGYGRVPQDVLDFFQDLEEEICNSNKVMSKQKETPKKMIDCLAIKNTKTHCKGVVYPLTEAEAKVVVESKLFEIVPLLPIIETSVE